MVSTAIEGFVTGFAGTLAKDVSERKREARDYFNKQVEFARTTGLENRNRVRQTVDASVAVARQLEQVGVPREVIMAQVNQNPQGLSDFYNQAEKIRASAGKELSADEWKAIYKVAGDFKAPDEDIATFIARTYDPIANAASSPEFQDDPEGSLISTMMGFNAMDQARAELARTDIGNGMTADELIRYGDVQPQRIGGTAVVTTNYEALPSESSLSISETSQISKLVQEQVMAALTKLESSPEANLTEGADITPLRDAVVAQIADLYPQASVADIKRFADVHIAATGYTVDTEGAPTGADAGIEPPPDVSGGDGSQEPQTPPVEPPMASVSPDVYTTSDGVQLTLVRDNEDGTSTYMDPDGNEYRIATSLVRQ